MPNADRVLRERLNVERADWTKGPWGQRPIAEANAIKAVRLSEATSKCDHVGQSGVLFVVRCPHGWFCRACMAEMPDAS